MKRILFVALVVLVAAGTTEIVSAGSTKKTLRSVSVPPDKDMTHKCASCHSLSTAEAGKIFTGLGEVTAVKVSPVKGLYEVTVRQGNRQAVAYLDFGKKLLLPGPIFDTVTKSSLTPPPVELSKILSKEQLSAIPLTNSLVMGNPSWKKRLIFFTDPDCSFCARLHAELKKLVVLEPDLAIFVKMFPLEMHPDAYDKARVLLGSDSLELLEKAFAGEKLPAPGDNEPKEPFDETLKLGDSLGIDGTPTIIFPDGRFISGYRDVPALQELLVSE